VVDHRPAFAEQAAWGSARRRSPGLERHLVAVSHGSPWAEVPERFGPQTTCYNRFVRWRKAGVWDRLLAAVSAAYDGAIVMIDSSCVRGHQHAATGKKGMETMAARDVPAAA
jgi:transposase